MGYCSLIVLSFTILRLAKLGTGTGYFTVGGLFETWDHAFPLSNTLVRNDTGIQYLAAFLMAIQDINNKTDGIADNILKNYQLYPVVANTIDSSYYDTILGATYVFTDFVVGPNGENAMKYSSLLLEQFSIPQIGFNTKSSDLSDRVKYPYFTRVCSSDTAQSKWLATFVGNMMSWKRILVFSSSNTYGVDMESVLENVCSAFGVKILENYVFAPGSESFVPYFSSAEQYGAYIYVIIGSARDTGMMIEQGYNYGIFDAGTQVLVASDAITFKLWKYMSKKADVPKILKGVIGIIPTFDYQSSAMSKSFVKRFRALPPTQTVLPSGEVICHNDTDIVGNYMYRKNNLCLGLNFSGFASDGSDLDMYTANVYDAVLQGAYALDYYVKNRARFATTPYASAFVQSVVAPPVTFTGVTGFVNITAGFDVDGTLLGEGDRATDNQYYFVNFNADLYVSTAGSKAFSPVLKVWDSNVGDGTNLYGGRVMNCPECSPIVYSTADNSAPVDATPVKKVTLLLGQKISLFVLTGLSFLVLTLSTAMVVFFRKNRIIRTAQPSLLYVIILGGYLGCASSALSVIHPPSSAICVAQSWLGHMCFGFVFSALISKTWMVMKIFSSGLKRVKVSVTQALADVGVLMLILAAFLVVNTVVGDPHRTIDNTDDVHNPLPVSYTHLTLPTIYSV